LYAPGYAVNFWDFVWLEDGIGYTAERCADIESEDERTVIAAVRFPGFGGDGHQGRRPECVTEGKGEEREEIESKTGVKSEGIHTQRGRSLPFPDGSAAGDPAHGRRATALAAAYCLAGMVCTFPSFFFTSLPVHSLHR
jgi:hypothetical protein